MTVPEEFVRNTWFSNNLNGDFQVLDFPRFDVDAANAVAAVAHEQTLAVDDDVCLVRGVRLASLSSCGRRKRRVPFRPPQHRFLIERLNVNVLVERNRLPDFSCFKVEHAKAAGLKAVRVLLVKLRHIKCVAAGRVVLPQRLAGRVGIEARQRESVRLLRWSMPAATTKEDCRLSIRDPVSRRVVNRNARVGDPGRFARRFVKRPHESQRPVFRSAVSIPWFRLHRPPLRVVRVPHLDVQNPVTVQKRLGILRVVPGSCLKRPRPGLVAVEIETRHPPARIHEPDVLPVGHRRR